MALIEAAEFAGTKKWAETSAWVGGVVPTENDDVVFGEKSGNVELGAEGKCRSIESTAAYAKTFTIAAAVTLKVGTSTVNAEAVIWKWVGGTFKAATTTSQVTFASSSATQVKIFAAASSFGALKFTGKGSYKLEQKCETAGAGAVTIEECTWTSNGQECAWGSFNSSNALTRTVNIENSIIKLAATGTVWTLSTKTGLTFKPAGSTIEFTDTSATLKTFVPGTEQKFNKLKFSGGASIPKFKIGTTTTINILEFTEGQKATLECTSGIKITVEKIIAKGASGKLITIEAGTPAASFEFTATALSVFSQMDWVSFKDCHAAATSTWYAGANSTNVSGNENLKFETLKHEHTLEVAQAQSVAAPVKAVSRSLSVAQAQSPAVVKALSRTLTRTQGQSPTLVRAATRTLSVTQGQSAAIVRTPARVLTAANGQTVSAPAKAISRTLALSQPQTATFVRSFTRTLAATQGQAVTVTRAAGRILSSSQGQEAASTRSVARTLSASQGQSVAKSVVVSRTLSAAQPQEVTVDAKVTFAKHDETLSVSQGQSVSMVRSVSRVLGVTQLQSCSVSRQLIRVFSIAQNSNVTKTTVVTRALSASQGQSATVRRAAVRVLSTSQGQSAGLARAVARTLTATQPQAVTMVDKVVRLDLPPLTSEGSVEAAGMTSSSSGPTILSSVDHQTISTSAEIP